MSDTSHFAEDIQYEEAVAAIRGCDEFFEKEEEGVYCTKRTFPDPKKASSKEERLLKIRRECRGLMFDKETKKVIARRYHKFFNIGELEETHESNVDLSKKHAILVKYDGSLVSPVMTNGQVKFASKGGFGRITQLIEQRFLGRTDIPYEEFCRYWLSKDYTPLFEFCSPRVKIVLQYDEDLLMLTALRNNITGMYLPYNLFQETALKYNIPYASQFVGEISLLPEFLQITKSTSQIEGFVIQFEDGRFYKVKTEWYFARTKKDKQEFSLNSERSIWFLIINQEIDDALANCNDAHLIECIRNFEDLFWKELENTTNVLYDFVSNNSHITDKKQYFEAVNASKLSTAHKNILLKLTPNTTKLNVKDDIIDYLKINCSSKKFNTFCKPLLNNITFSEK